MRLLVLFDPEALESGHLKSLPGLLRSALEDVELTVPVFSFEAAPSPPRSCHGFSVQQITIFRTDDFEVSSRSVKDYVNFFTEKESHEVYFIALQMLNRLDLTGTLRFVDREAIVRLAIQRILEFLGEGCFRLVVFPNTPHTFFDYLAFSLCKFLCIPTLFFQPVPFAPLMIPHIELGKRKIISQANKKSRSEVSRLTKSLGQSLVRLLDGTPPKWMRNQRSMEERANTLVGKLRGLMGSLRWLTNSRFPESLDFIGSRLFGSPIKPSLVLLLSRGLESGLKDRLEEIDEAGKPRGGFALFALHYEPERTSVPEGYPITSQIDAIAIVRKILPDDLTLVVKEHKSQASPALRGFAGRSQYLYDFVSSLPNTILMGPGSSTSDLISQARCVVTLTGTIGIEAASRGVRVAYFGWPWWQGLPGTTRISSLTSFDDIVALPSSDAETTIRTLVKALDGSAILGICSEDPTDYQQRNGPLEETFWESSSRAILSEICDLL